MTQKLLVLALFPLKVTSVKNFGIWVQHTLQLMLCRYTFVLVIYIITLINYGAACQSHLLSELNQSSLQKTLI